MFGVRANREIAAHDRDSAPAEASGAPDCLFCKLNRPDLNNILQQNGTFYARYDNFPAAEGHVEIVPKRHVESLFELTPAEVHDAYALMVAVQRKLSADHRPDGWTVGVNEGRAAGRTIDHLHIHLIPRTFGDVEDPRGGIRQVVPNCHPETWAPAATPAAGSAPEVAPEPALAPEPEPAGDSAERGSECADVKR
ncbi:HIT family protein [Streptomyces sp. SID3343]|uniref:HIT family protein n=1 Tax=Streptomyces sp. SID3343 TaxID=2690260 RepID=UPI00136F40DE|nr:HIT family protein [Streptomyces sp. SID3343]MYW05391.1 HIT domain-containing protein [Streptomyces sp. SID3343]